MTRAEKRQEEAFEHVRCAEGKRIPYYEATYSRSSTLRAGYADLLALGVLSDVRGDRNTRWLRLGGLVARCRTLKGALKKARAGRKAAAEKAAEYNVAVAAVSAERRAECVETCLGLEPVPALPHPLGLVFSFARREDGWLKHYAGCGKGTAYLKCDGFNEKTGEGRNWRLIAWHYGYTRPSNAPECDLVCVGMLSCTEFCTF